MGDAEANLDKYNPGSEGDVPRVVKTKQKILSYGDTPPDVKLRTFKKLAERSGIEKVAFARKITEMSWKDRMELLKVHYSSDKQVLKILDKASQDNEDHEDEVDARKRSYGKMKHPERNVKKLKVQHSIKDSQQSRNTDDHDSFYDDEDDDKLLSLAFNDEPVSASSINKESATSRSTETAVSSNVQSENSWNLEPIIEKETSFPKKSV